MRFMLIRKADADTEAGLIPSPKFIEAMTSYNQQMIEAGVMVQGVGLRASREGARVRVSDRRAIDGPFTETKELIAGFTMIDVASLEEAIEWTRRWPAIYADAEIEIRRVHEPEDFGDLGDVIREQDRLLEKRE